MLLGQFPPQHLVILLNYFVSLDRRNKKRWKLENIALTVFDLSKHVNYWVEARKPRCIDSVVDAFRVMYQHFDNAVTRKIQERRSSATAILRATERSKQRRPLPNNFMYTLRKVSERQRLLLVFGHVTHLFNCLLFPFLFCRGLTSLVQVAVMRWLSSCSRKVISTRRQESTRRLTRRRSRRQSMMGRRVHNFLVVLTFQR